MKHKILYTIGLNSICYDGNNILMLDYDIEDFNLMYNELISIAEKYYLSECYILKSTNGFNVFCLDKLDLNTLKQIFKDTKLCDNNFKQLSIKKGFSTIRLGLDKQYFSILYSVKNTNKYIKSNSHKKALNYYYDVPINNNSNFDDSKDIIICLYENIKYGVDIAYG